GNLHGAGIGPRLEHDVDTEVFHGGVEILLYQRAESVDLVDEQHIALIKVGEQPGQVARFIQYRSGRYLNARPHLVGDDMRQRGFAKPWRTVKQYVVQRFSAQLGRLHENAQIFQYLLLTCEILKSLWTQHLFQFTLGAG